MVETNKQTNKKPLLQTNVSMCFKMDAGRFKKWSFSDAASQLNFPRKLMINGRFISYAAYRKMFC